MAVTLALLAINQEEQERVYRHIMNTVGLRDLVSQARTVAGAMISNFLLELRRLQQAGTRPALFP